MNFELEKDIVTRFIDKKRQGRFLWLIESPKRRHRIFDDLRDTRYFDKRYTHEITGPEKFTGPLIKTLTGLGVKGSIYIICSESEYDGTYQDMAGFLQSHLWDIEEIVGFSEVSKIGFFKNHEDWFYILQKYG
jgi:hypothetical protein